MRGEALRNAGLMVISVAVALALAEFAVRLFVTVRDVGPSFTVHDPVLGKRLKASFSAQRIAPEFRMHFSTNSQGFRGPEPAAFPRHPILFLGDSFTMGYGVNDGEEYPAKIAAELRRRFGDAAPSVLNAGIGDSGNGFWVKFLRTKADAFQPRLVVMQVLDNDFTDNLNEKLFAIEAGESLRELPVPAPGAARRLQAVIEAVPGLSDSYLVGLMRQLRLSASGPRAAPPSAFPQNQEDPKDRLTLRILEEAISICKARGWPALGLLVGLPEARAVAISNLYVRQGIPIVIVPGKSARPDLYYKIDGHWHAAGQAFVAARVLEAMETLGVARR